MMMHRHSPAGRWHGYLQYPHEGIFKNNLVAVWSRLHCVVAIWKTRWVLAVRVKMYGKQCQTTHDQDTDGYSTSSWRKCFSMVHDAKYIRFYSGGNWNS